MKDFRLFDIYDFLMDEDFIRWVKEGRKADNEKESLFELNIQPFLCKLLYKKLLHQ